MPTPPAPKIAIVIPGCACATLNTAPRPVSAPQLNTAANSSGTSSGIFTSDSCAQIVRSVNAVTPR